MGVSRQTLPTWLARYEAEGLDRLDRLRRAGVMVAVTNASAMASACGGPFDAVGPAVCVISIQPALRMARKRRVGGFGWSRMDSDELPEFLAPMAPVVGEMGRTRLPSPGRCVRRPVYTPNDGRPHGEPLNAGVYDLPRFTFDLRRTP